MNTNVTNVLGSEYTESIEREIRKLKQTDQLMLGDILAVVKRSDTNLGRPIEDCNVHNDATYVIFAPTKYSIVCHKDMNTIRNEGSEFVFITLNSFVGQLLEFNFTFLQVLLCGDYKYSSPIFDEIRTDVIEIMNKEYDTVFHKNLSLITGVKKDIDSGKFKDKQAQDRVFLVYCVYEMLSKYIKTNKWVLDNNLDLGWYRYFVTEYSCSHFSDLAKKINELYNFENAVIDIDRIKKTKDINKIKNKYNLLRYTYRTIELDECEVK